MKQFVFGLTHPSRIAEKQKEQPNEPSLLEPDGLTDFDFYYNHRSSFDTELAFYFIFLLSIPVKLHIEKLILNSQTLSPAVSSRPIPPRMGMAVITPEDRFTDICRKYLGGPSERAEGEGGKQRRKPGGKRIRRIKGAKLVKSKRLAGMRKVE